MNLFGNNIEYLCENCYKRNPISLELVQVPLESYHCYILTMFSKRNNIHINYYFREYNQIIKQYFHREGYFFLFFDSFSLTDRTIEVLDVISKLFQKNLFILAIWIKK